MLTPSLGWTPSPARLAITSLAFMFEEVPEPVWKTSIGNWSSCSPAATASPAAAIRSATSTLQRAELSVDPRRRRLQPPEPVHDRRRDALARDREVLHRLGRLAAPELLSQFAPSVGLVAKLRLAALAAALRDRPLGRRRRAPAEVRRPRGCNSAAVSRRSHQVGVDPVGVLGAEVGRRRPGSRAAEPRRPRRPPAPRRSARWPPRPSRRRPGSGRRRFWFSGQAGADRDPARQPHPGGSAAKGVRVGGGAVEAGRRRLLVRPSRSRLR